MFEDGEKDIIRANIRDKVRANIRDNIRAIIKTHYYCIKIHIM